MKVLYVLLVAVPMAWGAHVFGAPPWITFLLSLIGLAPVSELLGDIGEDLAVHAGPRFGGLVATMTGNAPEMILAALALQAGLLTLVKASITGTILANQIGSTGLYALGVGWPMLLGTVAWASGLRKLRRGDVV